ncbi:MAG TPA: SIS domain-containing protein [Candidatus Limnocylindrales bacterium]|nr:SIS domain-containing protein [Candidatus Limnocylindrales bacterium]
MTTDRVALLREDILGGPAALAELLDAYAAPDGPLEGIGQPPGRVVFTGLGSSRYAATMAAALARSAGIAAWAEYASTSLPTPPAPSQVVVAISASGGTREVVAAAERDRATGRLIAVTNDERSPLAASANVVLPLFAGREGSGIATRTFRATVAVLAMLIERWSGRGDVLGDPRKTLDALRAVLDGNQAWVSDATDHLDGAPAIDVMGDAADSALVHQGALMLREAPRLPATGHDTADWLHTAVYLAFPGHRALVFRGSSGDEEVVDTIRRRGGETIVVGASAPGAALTIDAPQLDGAAARAVVLSVIAELLALELWDRASADEIPAPG